MSDSDDFSDDFASDDSGSLDLEGASPSFSFFLSSFFSPIPTPHTAHLRLIGCGRHLPLYKTTCLFFLLKSVAFLMISGSDSGSGSGNDEEDLENMVCLMCTLSHALICTSF